MQRIDTIKQHLITALSPSKLEIIDDSHKHIGHAGAANGAGHFTVIISSPQFKGKPLIKCHQMVYAALDSMMGPEIHALSIKVIDN